MLLSSSSSLSLSSGSFSESLLESSVASPALSTWSTGAPAGGAATHLVGNQGDQIVPDDMEDEEEGHEEVEDVVDREHLNQLECGEGE